MTWICRPPRKKKAKDRFEIPLAGGPPVVYPRGSICGKREFSCVCAEPPDHTTPHACVEACGGSWRYSESGDFIVVKFPAAAYE